MCGNKQEKNKVSQFNTNLHTKGSIFTIRGLAYNTAVLRVNTEQLYIRNQNYQFGGISQESF